MERLYICFWLYWLHWVYSDCAGLQKLKDLQLSSEPVLHNLLVFFHPLNIGLCPFNDLLQSSSCMALVFLFLLPLKLLQLRRDNSECLCQINGGNIMTDWDIVNYYTFTETKNERVIKFWTRAPLQVRRLWRTFLSQHLTDCLNSWLPLHTCPNEMIVSHMSIYLWFPSNCVIKPLGQLGLSFIYSRRQPLDPELLLIFDSFM